MGPMTVYSFNECPSVPKDAVKRIVSALKRAKLLPKSTAYACKHGRITITITHPAHVPSNNQNAGYRRWKRDYLAIIKTMVISIQSQCEARDVVRHIGELPLVA